MPLYTVICDWTDDFVADSDEMQIWAKNAAGATSRARAMWSATKGAEWPNCALDRVWILQSEKTAEYA